MPISEKILQQVLTKISDYAGSNVLPERLALIKRFSKLYFSQMPAEDLIERSAQSLYGTLVSHLSLMDYRKPGELKVKVFNPNIEQHGWQSTHTIVQIITENTPFMVDTMRMEINRLQLTTHLMIFSGGLKVKRNEEGKLEDLHSFHDKHSDCLTEAPIQMEIDKQTNPAMLDNIAQNISRVLADVRASVEDWPLMCTRLEESIKELVSKDKESSEFLQWMLDDHFTFLGCRDYEIVGSGTDIALRIVPDSGLGVLRDDTNSKLLRQYADLPKEARDLALSSQQALIISKTNTMSTVHRPAYTDYVGVKRYDTAGKLIGERRFIGLYTSEAYRTDPRYIPLIKHKVFSIIERSQLPLQSHSGKDLLHIISTLPRDDLFHASSDELSRIANGILQLQERRCTRLFVRQDAYNRFVSCLIYLPRENLNTEAFFRIQDLLCKTFDGSDVSHNTRVSESVLAQLHYVIRVNPKKTISYNHQKLEACLKEITRSWEEELHKELLDYFGEERGSRLVEKYRRVFPAGYRETFEPSFAVADIDHIESLDCQSKLAMSFYRPLGAASSEIRFKLYKCDNTVPLSDAVPLLENMGLRVISEEPYQIIFRDESEIWINDFGMSHKNDSTLDVDHVREIFQDAFLNIWLGNAENDTFNCLVLQAEMTWREISVLRAYAKYFRQMEVFFTEQYIAETLIQNYRLAKLLVQYFKQRFNPKNQGCSDHSDGLIKAIETELDQVETLDEDRVIRRYLSLINATLRTNYFQLNDKGDSKPYLALKFDSGMIPDLPLPLPKYEIYVYSPRFEGVHLRCAKVARGGIRWSDRREDFRTEVLGLMKAQQVKNALIVPAGAKGGFVTKCLPVNGNREQVLQEGIACYQNFIRGLLDVTDNRVDGAVVKHENTVCYDDEDPYIVVAADKGTATFSDIANCISQERHYWLGDAFASGGSTGYDHKKMGITARGAWVSAERHFQDLGVNLNESVITVIGIGDMSGDVFGNGMLMSSRLKLVAAFNHRHIFLDPDPDVQKSFAERKRLFALPRSSWEDYDRSLISSGGGIYSRSAKAISLSSEAQVLLGLAERKIEPNELIKAILKAPVDLLWNGGIGTYVKAGQETDVAVGDRSNDPVRINGNQLRARVVCEGGNLGLTQLARVEYELSGGKMNTDFIDNSAGVDCSDHEVNIKILLNEVVTSGDLTHKQRNQLLVDMTGEVARLVLQDNYLQNKVTSLSSNYALQTTGLYLRFIHDKVAQKKLNRQLEFLPSDKEVLERRSSNIGFTRPEISVLLAYSKNILKDEIIDSSLIEDPYLQRFISTAFPAVLCQRFQTAMKSHYLANDIIATQLSNQIVSDMGIGFVFQMRDEMGAPIDAVVKAYIIAREIFSLDSYNRGIEALDYQVDAELQYRMMRDGMRLVRRAVRWFLRNRRDNIDIEANIEEFSAHVKNLFERLPKLLLAETKHRYDSHIEQLVESRVPKDVAIKAAGGARIYHALNIIEAAAMYEEDVFRVAKIYFMLVDRLDLLWFRDQINAYSVTNRWSILAKAAYKGDLDWVQRELTVSVLRGKARSIPGKVNDWLQQNEAAIERWKSIISDLRSSEKLEFALMFVAIRELLGLAESSMRIGVVQKVK